MQTNQHRAAGPRTHGGAPAFPKLTPIQQLRRSVLACLLWEDGFYEDGESIAERIVAESAACTHAQVHTLAVEARHKHHLRHVPLLLAVAEARHGRLTPVTVASVVQRADELAELVSLYWKDGKRPLANALKKGLAKAFCRFDGYQLAKYNRDRAITLRDVMFMVHPKPQDAAQAEVWKRLAEGTLPSPDTWEVSLSSGADKKETFERLLREGNLGYLALLRNLRNMEQAGVDSKLVKDALHARKGAQRVLPFRYIAASRACPRYEADLNMAMQVSIDELPKLSGNTVVLVDISGSMNVPLSQRSDLRRMDAAAALAVMVNGDDKRVFSFSDRIVEVPARAGMGGVEAIVRSQMNRSTDLAGAVEYINRRVPCDRLIVITDEQSTSGRGVPDPKAPLAYMINVASNQNGVGYGKWTHIDGFSENVIQYLHELEGAFARSMDESVPVVAD